ncbi:2-hydroxyacid dehydrogenase [Spirosoma foliorum]|uniref:2-hydroxyacid dehydrogenase n=1 Tax=Spirosoma foliorum TaxID=2710596 RepID=A0A7G5GQ80_9BACT|nr:2-hydroxyacid dehydrogenase [Spirosoma foliorum]QMW01022.1 2-hydroxyacid dehydrogenase [Spirosoma foliorum]
MKIAFFSALPVEEPWYELASNHCITYIPQPLTLETAALAIGHRAVCASVKDDLSRPVLKILKKLHVSVIGMRCVGQDTVDSQAMAEFGITLLRLPGHSPYAVAEQAVALLLGLIRHLPEANSRVRTGNFSLDGLIGTDLHGKTVGVIGTGRIGSVFARIMLGFGCNVLAYDIRPDPRHIEAGIQYGILSDLLPQVDILSLHCPLTPLTDHLINSHTLSALKPTTVLINTARGRLVDTMAILDALDAGQLAGYAADVYEWERAYFHYDYTNKPITDELLNRLRNHPNVLLTAHQAFLTEEALRQTARNLLNQFTFYESQQTILFTKASLY